MLENIFFTCKSKDEKMLMFEKQLYNPLIYILVYTVNYFCMNTLAIYFSKV